MNAQRKPTTFYRCFSFILFLDVLYCSQPPSMNGNFWAACDLDVWPFEPTINPRTGDTARHSGDWLFALPIASCGLKLDDEAVRVAVGLRHGLGLDLCVSHLCRCGSPVDARGLHSLVCKQVPGRSSRHHVLNDLVARAFAAAGVPVAKEPVGLVRQDGKMVSRRFLLKAAGPWRGSSVDHAPTVCGWGVIITVVCRTLHFDQYLASRERSTQSSINQSITQSV